VFGVVWLMCGGMESLIVKLRFVKNVEEMRGKWIVMSKIFINFAGGIDQLYKIIHYGFGQQTIYKYHGATPQSGNLHG
jgi:hypothetical protein